MTLRLILGLAALLVSACTSTPQEPVQQLRARQACEALATPVAASDIVLPSRGAVVTSAVLQGQGGHAVCRVRGRIVPLTAGLAALDFEVNLPVVWSGRAVQLGDGGFVAPDPRERTPASVDDPLQPPATRPDRLSPLARGDVVFGLALAQQSHREVDWRAVATQAEALRDLAYGGQKKLRDVAVALVRRHYGQTPDRLYFMGSGEAGRQALALVQRHPTDYDGVFSLTPSVGWTGQQHAALRASLALGDAAAGWLRPAQVAWLAQSVRAACDGLDGLMDGVIAQPQACATSFDLAGQRCPGGRAAGDRCLSDAQLSAVQTLHTPYVFEFALAHGVIDHPAAAWGGEDLPPAGEAGGWLAWWTGLTPPALPVRVGQGLAWAQVSQAIPRLYAQGHDATVTMDALRRYHPTAVAGRVREVSALMDATDPNLARFAALGGRLIVMEHLADQARSPFASMAYFDSLVARLGAPAVERFARLYAVPGAGHRGHGAASQIDMLEVLEGWVERAQPPGTLEVVDLPAQPPLQLRSARPLCRWPAYPRYRGQGDTARAESFVCSRP